MLTAYWRQLAVIGCVLGAAVLTGIANIGITAVDRVAVRRPAQTASEIRITIRFVIGRFDVDWIIDISSPRTMSRTLDKISPYLNAFDPCIDSPTATPRWIDHARGDGLARELAIARNQFGFGDDRMAAVHLLVIPLVWHERFQ